LSEFIFAEYSPHIQVAEGVDAAEYRGMVRLAQVGELGEQRAAIG